MSTTEIKSVDLVTSDMACILTRQFNEVDGNLVQVGLDHRSGYDNSESGRQLLLESEPEDIVTEVMAVWGDAPTVEEFKVNENFVPGPTAEERIAVLEEQIATMEDNDAELLYQICLLQLGITEEDMM